VRSLLAFEGHMVALVRNARQKNLGNPAALVPRSKTRLGSSSTSCGSSRSSTGRLAFDPKANGVDLRKRRVDASSAPSVVIHP
jgi:hypothetical protein